MKNFEQAVKNERSAIAKYLRAHLHVAGVRAEEYEDLPGFRRCYVVTLDCAGQRYLVAYQSKLPPGTDGLADKTLDRLEQSDGAGLQFVRRGHDDAGALIDKIDAACGCEFRGLAAQCVDEYVKKLVPMVSR